MIAKWYNSYVKDDEICETYVRKAGVLSEYDFFFFENLIVINHLDNLEVGGRILFN